MSEFDDFFTLPEDKNDKQPEKKKARERKKILKETPRIDRPIILDGKKPTSDQLRAAYTVLTSGLAGRTRKNNKGTASDIIAFLQERTLKD